MNKKQRRQPTLKERMTPCTVCLYPLSQRHHLFPFKLYGEMDKYTIQLCANCHDLYHTIERIIQKQPKCEALFEVETDEEKKIRFIIELHPHLAPLLYLAAYSVRYESLSPEDNAEQCRCVGFIVNFKQYVEDERKKRDQKFKEIAKSGRYEEIFGSILG